MNSDNVAKVARNPGTERLAMADGYESFLAFDWSDERWRTYLNGLYPPPNQEQIAKFKKKWYKKNIDAAFDDSYEPPPPPPPETPAGLPNENGPLPKSIYHDGARWGAIGQKATICFGVFPPYQATVIMVVSFVLEIVAKFGVKLSKTYMHNVLVDDVGTMPILAATVLMPGLHPKVRLLAVLPLFLTALLSLGQICKFHIRLPSFANLSWQDYLVTLKPRHAKKIRRYSKKPNKFNYAVTYEKTKSLSSKDLAACYDFLCQTMRNNDDAHFYTQDSFVSHLQSLEQILIARGGDGQILGFYSGAVIGHDHSEAYHRHGVYHNLFIEHVKSGFGAGDKMIDLGNAGDFFKHELGAKAFRLAFSLRGARSLRGGLALTAWAAHSWIQVLKPQYWPFQLQILVLGIVASVLWMQMQRWFQWFQSSRAKDLFNIGFVIRKCIQKGAPPLPVRDFWSPLASAKARKQVMRARADVEVGLGIIMVVGALGMYCAPITVILFWNFMMMRYMMSSWTQDSFQRMDKLLSPVLLKVPGIKQGYQALKGWLYSYVDPESKSAGKLCTIL
eukprot:symbB.v1.2.002350.t2/scaffold121.1/size317807/14